MRREITRRKFISKSTLGTTAVGMTAASYARVAGANDRINLGLIGCGGRGIGTHVETVATHAKQHNVTFVAVADPWRQHREAGQQRVKELFGEAPQGFVSYRDLLGVKDLDAVMIASCDHQHTTHLKAVAEAKKDVYVEKPLAMDLEQLKAACDACVANNVVAQVGTQQRSEFTIRGARKVYETGILGTVSRIEQHRNAPKPYWYTRVADVDARDVDWDEFLCGRPKEPYSSLRFRGWYGFLDFSDGPVSQWGAHYLDAVAYITGADCPESCVCLGNSFVWKDDMGFDCPDHVQAQWIYPEGFMVSYVTNFGNSFGNCYRIYGDVGLIDLVVVHAPTVYLSAEGGSKNKGAIRGRTPIEEVQGPDHWENWLTCLRTREKCHAPIEAGYRHAVGCIMARKSFDTGARTTYDAKQRKIKVG